MHGPLPILARLLAGFCLGAIFFGGLWLTVRALPRSRHPAALMLGSLWGRTTLVVVGFIWAMENQWQNALVCLLGFLIPRFVLARWIPGGTAGDEMRGRYGHNT